MANRPDTKTLRQQIRYVKATDGTQLAWAQSGHGPTLVKAANWLTHLEYEWRSPVWKHWLEFFSAHFRFVRYDERGCGMSGWRPATLTLDQWAADLRAVIDVAQPEGPVILLGISQGAAVCVHYALQHPERVAALILYGGYARGSSRRNADMAADAYRAMIDLARFGWGKDNPTFRQIFTSRFIPGGTPEQLQWFTDLCQKTTTGEIFASLHSARSAVDIEASLAAVGTRTLVLHSRDDEVIPVAEGRLLAASIPGAEFVELDSRNHILLEGEPAWRRFQEAVLEFARPDRAAGAAVFAGLSEREREVLALITDGLSNTDIAARLKISEKTVRNHTSNLFDKLGVWSRAQAIVFARDHGFS
ncbi:MAG TPA: alpha/beta fold hydrolase [Steroidobacteraceae bacterium]|jgi:pimeloyl-ACP methyl ester carboxylesterase/DNA-binding CsgD family transcriptional regulator